MKDIEKDIAAELKSGSELAFATSDDDLFRRATKTVNNQQGTKDLLALGMASLWVVFMSIFMKILKPIFKQMARKPKIRKETKASITTNGNT
ncbi:hypothetical protein [Colwellia psychrerythraea]|uniref:Uncharacterized protein n=1 Tax=Colwellia psychrerythraea TaxID=28229 RepID=A0A099KBR1_COLPS|nr:hypothetical protein [Colwellia psychrerythraea]KGJ87028.1 hypothetical protein ND2E_0435 [Colwellia psychrerythraea]